MSITDHRYVSLTSFKRNGEGVDVPVWIADLGDGRAGFTTAGDSWKVKRIRRNASVVLRPCDLRGNVDATAEPVAAQAFEVRDGPDFELIRRKILEKYRIQAGLLRLGAPIARLFGRSAGDCCILLTFPDA